MELFEYIKEGNIEKIKLLINNENDININARNNKGYTPLYYASRKLEQDQPMAGEIFLTAYFEQFTRTRDESFMKAIETILTSSKAIPISKIKHPLLDFLKQEITNNIYMNADYPQAVPRFDGKIIRLNKIISSAA